MFATAEGTVDQALERRREARRCRLRWLCEQQARIQQEVTQIVRAADGEGDWRAAGCSSSASWLAQVSSSEYRNAQRITRTSEALRNLPALDHALGTGALTLDQVTAATQFATRGIARPDPVTFAAPADVAARAAAALRRQGADLVIALGALSPGERTAVERSGAAAFLDRSFPPGPPALCVSPSTPAALPPGRNAAYNGSTRNAVRIP